MADFSCARRWPGLLGWCFGVCVVGCGASNNAANTRQPALEARIASLEERVTKLEQSASADRPAIVQTPEQTPDVVPEENVTLPSGREPELIGENRYRVPRAYFDEMIEKPDTMRQVRLVPVQTNQQVTGLRLFGIRAGSRLAKLGLENGDQLQSLNGISLLDPDSALEAYTKLRAAQTLVVKLVRRGKTIELTYDLEGPAPAARSPRQ